MRIRRFQSVAIAAILVPAFALTACGPDSSDDDSKATAGESASSSESVEPTEEPTEESSSTAPADGANGAQPAWALPVTKPGELLTTAKVGDVTVEIYQVGQEKAPKDGMFVNPDTNEPILKKGDDLIFVNYVITNNGEPIDLGILRVDVTARYANWKWLQGMDGVTDSALWEARGVNKNDLPLGYDHDSGYVFEKGQTYSYGENFAYQKGSDITFALKYTPVDADGEMVHDERVEAKVDTKIK